MYQQVKQELSVSNGIILRGTCIIVPEKATRSNDYASSQWSTGDCQDEAFSAQFSLVSRIERMVEKVVKGFLLCQAANHDPKPVCEPLHISPTLPLGLWQELSMDFCSPFQGGNYLLVVTDK